MVFPSSGWKLGLRRWGSATPNTHFPALCLEPWGTRSPSRGGGETQEGFWECWVVLAGPASGEGGVSSCLLPEGPSVRALL